MHNQIPNQRPAPSPLVTRRLPLLAVLVVFLPLLLYDFTAGFGGDHRAALETIILRFAESHLRFGLSQTRGFNVLHVDADGQVTSYRSYPGTLSLLTAALIKLFGHRPWVLRLIPTALTILMFWSFWRLARRHLPDVPPWAPPLIFAGLPLVLLRGTMPDFATVTLVFFVLALDCFLVYDQTGRLAALLRTGAWLALGLLLAWPPLIPLFGFMAVTAFWPRRPAALPAGISRAPLRQRWSKLLVLAALPLTVAIGILLFTAAVGPELLGGFGEGLAKRLSLADYSGSPIPLDFFLKQQAERFWQWFGPVSCVLLGVWLIDFLVRLVQHRTNRIDLIQWMLVAWGLPYGLLLVNGAFYHDFYLYHFIPAVVIGASLGLAKLIQLARSLLPADVPAAAITGVLVLLVAVPHFAWAAWAKADEVRSAHQQVEAFRRTADKLRTAQAQGAIVISLPETATGWNIRPGLLANLPGHSVPRRCLAPELCYLSDEPYALAIRSSAEFAECLNLALDGGKTLLWITRHRDPAAIPDARLQWTVSDLGYVRLVEIKPRD